MTDKKIIKDQLVNVLSEKIRICLKSRQELIHYQQRLYDTLKDEKLPHKDYIKAEKAYDETISRLNIINAEIAGWEGAREIVLNWGEQFE